MRDRERFHPSNVLGRGGGPDDIPRGKVACYFPEANPLVPAGSYARKSRTPTSKRVEVSIEALA